MLDLMKRHLRVTRSQNPDVYQNEEHLAVQEDPEKGSGQIIADMETGPDAERFAKLFAAAPDLFAALTAMIDAADDDEVFDHDATGCDSCALCQARAAIAKAES